MSARCILTLTYHDAEHYYVLRALKLHEYHLAENETRLLAVHEGRDPVRLTHLEVSGVGDVLEMLARWGVTTYAHNTGSSEFEPEVTIMNGHEYHSLPAFGDSILPAVPLAPDGSIRAIWREPAEAFNRLRNALFGADALFGVVDVEAYGMPCESPV